MSKEIEDKVVKLLTKGFIEIKFRWKAEVRKDNWDADEWEVRITTPGNKRAQVLETEFYTGLGLRKQPRHKHYAMLKPGCKHHGAPVIPGAALFLSSFLRDAEAIEMSFNDWCSEMGMSSDSIKDLNTYQECCKIGEKVRQLFPYDLRKKLKEALQDY